MPKTYWFVSKGTVIEDCNGVSDDDYDGDGDNTTDRDYVS